MPYDNVPESKWAEMDKCVEDVMAEGEDKETATAICYASIVEGKSLTDIPLKVGMRNNRRDRESVRQIRNAARQIHDITIDLEPNDIDQEQEMPEVTMISIASVPIKALGNGKVGGYLITFTDENKPDLVGDFFNSQTDYGIEPPARIPAYFHHGMNPAKKRLNNRFMDIKQDEFGLWAETILDERDRYEAFLYTLAQDGKLGLSSGAAPHLYEAEPKGNSNWIKTWVIAEGSVTHTPAEPKNVVIPLKSLGDLQLPDLPEAGEGSAEDGNEPEQLSIKSTIMEVTTMGDGLITTTKEELASLVKGALDEYTKSLPPVNATPAQVSVVKDEADQPFKSAGEFFKAVKNAAYYPSAEDRRLRPLKATGMSEGVPADGGYLLPTDMSANIMSRALSSGQILSRVAMDSVSGNTMVYNGIDESSHASTFYGGLLGYWLAEAGSKTASAPKFYQLELKLKKLAVLSYCTDEQLEDTPALESWLTRTVPEVIRFQVEDAIINGDGVGKPLGIMVSPCLTTQVRTTATYILLADIANMWGRRWLGANDYVWIMGQDSVAQLNQMVSTVPVYMPSGSIAGAPYGSMLYGCPVIESEYNAAVNTKGDIILASLSQYQAISKGGVQSASSIHVSFTTDETAFRWVYRIDGAPTWNSELTTAHGDTVSPFVCLSSACAS